MSKLMLLGDEALSQGAIDAGISGFYGYPGTPSTEIMEYAQKSKIAEQRNIHRRWSANEKTAAEAALGMSYAGKRALVSMKHVGLNVAADCFMNSSITGANGGIIITVADDPSMHSSQNEQDSRYYGKFALMPTFEPSNQQECYDMAKYCFEFSEKYGTPVLLRLTTRLSHSRAGVKQEPIQDQNQGTLPEDQRQFVLLPAIARRRYKHLLQQQEAFEQDSDNSPFNKYIEGSDSSMGIVACGIAYNYLMENYGSEENCPFSVVKVSQYPLPRKMITKLYNQFEKILVLEDGYPIVEEMLKGYMNDGGKVVGRLDGTIPRDGELNPNIVKNAISGTTEELSNPPEILSARPPMLCQACPHIDSYKALNVAVKDKYGDGHVFSDIGCYTLGALPPFESINTTVDMGASITMAKGASDAGLFPAVAVIGDSTFTHSGMTGLLDAVVENANIVVCIFDNSTTAMTGGQDSQAFNRLENIVKGLGVDENHIRKATPLAKHHDELVKIIEEEIAYEGVSVIIPTRECVQTMKKRLSKK